MGLCGMGDEAGTRPLSSSGVSGYGWRRSEADDLGDQQLGADDIGKHPAVITVNPAGCVFNLVTPITRPESFQGLVSPETPSAGHCRKSHTTSKLEITRRCCSISSASPDRCNQSNY
jgi:hypothetical protein